jgi:hypothetical protein
MSFVTTRARIRKGVVVNAIAIIVLLLVCILLATQTAEARPDHKIKRNKSKKHVIHSNSHRTCYLLYKKRTYVPKQTFATARRNKPKPMAETDSPAKLVAAN